MPLKDKYNALPSPPSPPREPVNSREPHSAAPAVTVSPLTPQSSLESLLHQNGPIFPPDEQQKELYYFGLPSQPPLLARSSTSIWELQLDVDGHPKQKELKTVGCHRSVEVWGDPIISEIVEIFRILCLKWTSIEIFRIGYEGQDDKPVVLWIGVLPGTLADEGTPPNAAGHAAVACKRLLIRYGISDVECEIKESEVYRDATYATPALVKPSPHSSPVVDVDVFLTPTLGTCISPKDQPKEGTFGMYLTFPEHPRKVFGLTCRHLFFAEPYTQEEDKVYHYKHRSGEPRRFISLPGKRRLGELKERALKGIRDQDSIIGEIQRGLARREVSLADSEAQVTEARRTILGFNQLLKDLDTQWTSPESRVIGHIIYSHPIRSSQPDNYTYDWCLYEVDASKIRNFQGNVIDLGYEVTRERIKEAMNPNIVNPYKFVYPEDRLLRVRNECIPLKEMFAPKTVDIVNKGNLSVLKRGSVTGVTLGTANEVISYTRHYRFTNGSILSFDSMEWAIVGSNEFKRFSMPGDSGSLVVDAQGRMGGIVTGGTAFYVHKRDITYATPMLKLFADMERHGWRHPNADVMATQW